MPRAIFDSTECDRRIARTKERMAKRGLDVLFASDPTNMNYLTGYDGWSFYVHQGVMVTRDRNEPVWVGRDMDTNGMRVTTALSEGSIRPYSDGYVQPPHDLRPIDFVTVVLKDLDVDDARVGLGTGACCFATKPYTRLQKNLTEASFKDTTLPVNRVRIRKFDVELGYVCEAAHISKNTMQTSLDVIETNVPKYEVAEAIYSVLIERTDDYDGDYPSIVPLIPSGDHTDTSYLTQTDRGFEDGDPVIIELSGCHHHYYSPLAQMTFVGDPPEGLSRRADIVVEGTEAALDAIAPGVACEAVEKTWRDAITQRGIEKRDRIGYSMGLSYPPDWGEHTANLRPGDETILEENMTSHTIPGLWFDDFDAGLNETFVVTSDGAEPLAGPPHRLFTI